MTVERPTLPFMLFVSQQAFLVAVPIASVVVPFLVAFVATRKPPGARVLHGLLIRSVATAMRLAHVIGAFSIAEAVAGDGLTLFVIVNALRMLGAVAGGYAASRQPAA